MPGRRKRLIVAGGAWPALMLVLSAWIPSGPAGSREPAPDREAPALERLGDLRADLAEILSIGGRWRNARWSVLAVSLDTGDTLFAERPHEALAPASNMKLLTTAAALHHLGPDFRYQTFLLAGGEVEGGRLLGDLILYGTGDPGISDRFQSGVTSVFEAFADSLLAMGVSVVEGDVVGDGSYFAGPSLGEGWSPEDLNDWFAAPTGGLVLGESVFTLRVEPSPGGAQPRIHTLPPGAAVPMRNLAVIGSGASLRIQRTDPQQPIMIEGAIAPGSREVWRQMTVQDPAHFSASVLRDVLERKGLRVNGGVRVVGRDEGSAVTGRRIWAPWAGRAAPRVLARHLSPPLVEYLEVVNKRSHNLLADQVFRTVGRVVAGDGSYAGGARALGRFLNLVPGVDSIGLAIYDGSGLSALNRVSAADFVAVTKHMAGSEQWSAFWETLPEAGDPRGLRRMYRTAAQGNLRAKTGTIERVSALSGMVRSVDGERIAFSIISNQVPSTAMAKRLEDRIGTRLASFERPFEPTQARLAEQAPGDTVAGVESVVDSSRAATPVEVASAPSAPASPDPARNASASRTDVVRAGDNLTVIARRHGVTVAAIEAANPGLSPRRLLPGTELSIPTAEAAEAEENVTGGVEPAERRHRVARGETLSGIAETFGVGLDELLGANPGLSRATRLQIGQSIRIPGGGER